MNMIFELIGLLFVVGCVFFIIFFLVVVVGIMVVIFGWGIFIVILKLVICINDCIIIVFDVKFFGWFLIVFLLIMMFFIIRGMIKCQIVFSVQLNYYYNSVNLKLILLEGIIMMGRGINIVCIGDEVKYIIEFDVLIFMYEWLKFKKENVDLYDYNGQVNWGWCGFIFCMMGIYLFDNDCVCFQGINVRKDFIYLE